MCCCTFSLFGTLVSCVIQIGVVYVWAHDNHMEFYLDFRQHKCVKFFYVYRMIYWQIYQICLTLVRLTSHWARFLWDGSGSFIHKSNFSLCHDSPTPVIRNQALNSADRLMFSLRWCLFAAILCSIMPVLFYVHSEVPKNPLEALRRTVSKSVKWFHLSKPLPSSERRHHSQLMNEPLFPATKACCDSFVFDDFREVVSRETGSLRHDSKKLKIITGNPSGGNRSPPGSEVNLLHLNISSC